MNTETVGRIRNAVKAMIRFWQDEGDIASVAVLRSDAFHHLRWNLERMSLDEALKKMED